MIEDVFVDDDFDPRDFTGEDEEPLEDGEDHDWDARFPQ